jgi:hypothetical protein
MKIRKAFLVLTALFATSGVAAFAGSVVISSTTEASGKQHPGTTTVQGPAKVTCVAAHPGLHQATCYVTGPGLSTQLKEGASATTSGAGNVTLICNGEGFLSCKAQVDE